ncbi:hypothetical protein ACFL0Z_01015 [Patescibacteria group bacterium]
MPNLFAIYEFFNRAMLNGWGVNPQKGTIAEIPGSKTIPYEGKNFKLLDCWVTTPYGQESWGFIMIWERSGSRWIPVWVMSFSGWYEERAIPVVKGALMEMAKAKIFYGGRGGPVFTLNGMRYANVVTQNLFRSFAGREEVTDNRNGELLGFHEYSGMALFPVEEE